MLRFSFPASCAEVTSLKVTCARLAINYEVNCDNYIAKAPFLHAVTTIALDVFLIDWIVLLKPYIFYNTFTQTNAHEENV